MVYAQKIEQRRRTFAGPMNGSYQMASTDTANDAFERLKAFLSPSTTDSTQTPETTTANPSQTIADTPEIIDTSKLELAHKVLDALKTRYNGRNAIDQTTDEAAKCSLSLMRENVQSIFNNKLESLLQCFIEKYFKRALDRIISNLGKSAIPDDCIQRIGYALLENAKQQYKPSKHKESHKRDDTHDESTDSTTSSKQSGSKRKRTVEKSTGDWFESKRIKKNTSSSKNVTLDAVTASIKCNAAATVATVPKDDGKCNSTEILPAPYAVPSFNTAADTVTAFVTKATPTITEVMVTSNVPEPFKISGTSDSSKPAICDMSALSHLATTTKTYILPNVSISLKPSTMSKASSTPEASISPIPSTSLIVPTKPKAPHNDSSKTDVFSKCEMSTATKETAKTSKSPKSPRSSKASKRQTKAIEMLTKANMTPIVTITRVATPAKASTAYAVSASPIPMTCAVSALPATCAVSSIPTTYAVSTKPVTYTVSTIPGSYTVSKLYGTQKIATAPVISTSTMPTTTTTPTKHYTIANPLNNVSPVSRIQVPTTKVKWNTDAIHNEADFIYDFKASTALGSSTPISFMHLELGRYPLDSDDIEWLITNKSLDPFFRKFTTVIFALSDISRLADTDVYRNTVKRDMLIGFRVPPFMVQKIRNYFDKWNENDNPATVPAATFNWDSLPSALNSIGNIRPIPATQLATSRILTSMRPMQQPTALLLVESTDTGTRATKIAMTNSDSSVAMPSMGGSLSSAHATLSALLLGSTSESLQSSRC